jgi:hypothetical protein
MTITNLITTLALALVVGCDQGAEGDRCNPSLSHDECGNGLACTQPANCPENYCCPTSGPISSQSCQPGCQGGDIAMDAGGLGYCTAFPDACVDAPSE